MPLSFDAPPTRLETGPVGEAISPIRYDEVREEPWQTRFRQMQELAYNEEGMLRYQTEVFVRQARFMADFEDDYEQIAYYDEYFPSFRYMNERQLRTYFSWRTRYRQGVEVDVPISYLYVYAYECINRIGFESTRDALDAYLYLYRTYLCKDRSRQLADANWLRDFFFYYGDDLDLDFMSYCREEGLEPLFPQIFLFDSKADLTFRLYQDFSRYRIEDSVFYSEELAEDIHLLFHEIVEGIRQAFRKSRYGFESHLFEGGTQKPDGHHMLYPFGFGYVWTEEEPSQNTASERLELQLGPMMQYLRINGNWYGLRRPLTDAARDLSAYLIKEMERQMRLEEGFRYKLRPTRLPRSKRLVNLFVKRGIDLPSYIEETVQAYYRRKRQIAVEVLPINLARIRAEAEDVQARLTVEDESIGDEGPKFERIPESKLGAKPDLMLEAKPEQEENSEAITKSPWYMLAASLSEDEARVLRMLLSGDEPGAYIRGLGVMSEVFFDHLNEKAMDTIGDTLLDPGVGMELFDDYVADIEAMLGACER